MALSTTSSRTVFKLEKYSFSRTTKAPIPTGLPTTTAHERSTSGGGAGALGLQEWTHFTQPHLTVIWEEAETSKSGPAGPIGPSGLKARKLTESIRRARVYVVWAANETGGSNEDELETQLTQPGSQQASPREAILVCRRGPATRH